MSWNEARIALVAGGGRIRVDRDPQFLGLEGTPVPVVDVIDNGASVSHDSFLDWLQRRGFQIESEDPPRIRATLDDVTVLVRMTQGEIKGAVVTFTFGATTRSRLQHWKNTVKDLCQSCGFRLVSGSNEMVSTDEFEAILQKTFAWECLLAREMADREDSSN